jgi:hypothetical protein
MEGDEWSIEIIEKPRGMMIFIIIKKLSFKSLVKRHTLIHIYIT